MHVNKCVCVSVRVRVGVCLGVGGYSAGALIGMSEKEREGGREEKGGGGRSQSAAAERVSRCYCMSPGPMHLQRERHNTSWDSFPLPALICLVSFYGSYDLRKQSMVPRSKCQWPPP